MIILAIILYTLYLRGENIKRLEIRKQKEMERYIKLQNKIDDFEEYKRRVLQCNTTVIRYNIRANIFNPPKRVSSTTSSVT